MTALLGYFAFDGAPVPDRVESLFYRQQISGTTALRAPIIQRIGDAVIAMAGSPHLDGRVADAGSAPEAILANYLARGAEAIECIRGAFAVAIVEPGQRRAFLAIDRMGIERLAWGISEGVLAFGTSAQEVARLLSESPALNRQAVFDFMLAHMVPAPDTIFAGVHKLPAGTAVRVEAGSAREARYWTPAFRHNRVPAQAELRSSLLPTLRAAVESTRPDARTGAFLSGGLDSSTVTGLLAAVRSEPVKAFSVGFGVEEFNELPYARISARHFRCTHLEYEVTADDVVRILPEIAIACDEPFGNSSAIPTLACVDLAQSHGVEHLLAGDGGDELFGGNERYVTQRVFELYARVPGILRRLMEPAARLFDPEHSPLPFRKFSSYVQQANIPLPERFERWNLVYREGATSIFSQEFLEHIDPRYQVERMHEVWNACPSEDLLDRMLWYDWKYTLADNDLRKVVQMCGLRGMRVSFPMLDEDVIELALSVPSDAKIEGNVLRAFYKDAMRSFLPDEILSKQKHGFGLPFGQWLKTHGALQDLAYSSLDRLDERGIFCSSFLRRVAAEHREGHPGYYGYAIWDLVALEQWLEARERAGLSFSM